MKRIAALMALGLTLGACSADGGTDAVAVEAATATIADAGGEAADDVASGPGEVDVSFDVVDNRKVIRNARLTLHASDTREMFDRIVRMTEEVGGFVSNANVFPTEGEDDQPEVTITLRIPSDRLTTTMDGIKGAADEVVSESQDAQDVTEQFVDLEARRANLEALEVELRALLEEVRQQPGADPEKLLTVFRELSSVRGQIEQIQGQLNYLSDLTALATLEVFVSETPVTAPILAESWQPVAQARESLRSLLSSLQDMADWAINFALFTLPVLVLTLAIPAGVAWYGYLRWRRARGVTEAEHAAEA